MAVPKNAQRATYTGDDIEPGSALQNARATYPAIKRGDKGHVVNAHPFEVENAPEKPLCFYPASWGGLYYIRVSAGQITVIS